jgi:protein-tyrosine phosphatase
MTAGLIDVHSHLIPGVDDGCKSVEESILCARLLVQAGYSQSFCTPHIWPSNANTVHSIPGLVLALQARLDEEDIPLKLMPGGEINLRAEYISTAADEIVTYGLGGQFALIDMWHATIPDFVQPSIRKLQSHGMTVILAHPERMRAIQDDPSVIDFFLEMGVLLQGNLQCLSDAPHSRTREIAQQFLTGGRYFMLGTDLHSIDTLPARLAGLEIARQLVDAETFDQLTRQHPAMLIPTAID